MLTPNEEKIRKRWLITTIILAFSPFFLLSIHCVLYAFISANYQGIANCFILTFLRLIWDLIAFWVLWHCAYKKHGTAWLTFIICGTWLSSDIFFSFKSIKIIGILVFLFKIWWIYQCYQLRKVNIKIQVNAFAATDDYKKAVSSIRSATDIDDLTFRFHEAFREQPRHFSKALRPHYEEMKKQLIDHGNS